MSRQNAYLTGNKIYAGSRSNPTMGPVDDRLGYAERDNKARVRRNAILRRLKSNQGGKYASVDSLREV